MNEPFVPEKTSLGINSNLAAVLAYALGLVTGVLFLVLEKENRFVRFHAMQSLIVFGALAIVRISLSFIPLLGSLMNMFFLGPLTLVLWLLLMYKAYQGEYFKLPVLGDIAEKQLP